MAFWVVGSGSGGTPLHDVEVAHRGGSPHDYFSLQDRPNGCHRHENGSRHAHHDHDDHDTDSRLDQQHNRQHLHDHRAESVPIRNLAFLVIREGDDHSQTNSFRHTPSSSPSPSPQPYQPKESPGVYSHTNFSVPSALERTESGHSISADPAAHHHHHSPLPSDSSLLEDLQAARLVRDHVTSYRRRYPDSQPERILRALINPKSRGADFPLDNDALRSIFSAANELFFASRLTRRVTWDWSHSASEQYENHIVGTTALRRSARFGGWETLIVLSSPILRDTKYNRRLLISTFLHEMMHSFMFVTCGLKAKECGGHTKGFRQIAGIIDDWAGKDCLHLRDMEADLARWRGSDFPLSCDGSVDGHSHNGNNYAISEQHLEVSTHASYPERHNSSKHEAQFPHAPSPQRHATQEEWQWYERENFGERLQYVAQTQYVP